MNMFIKPHWIIMVLAAVGMGGCTEEKTPKKPMIRPVNAIRVADSSGLTQRAFPGRARAGQEVNLSFRVAGPLIAFPAAVGKKVKRREVVARIDPRDFETALRTVEGQLERENARVKRAQADLERLENIYKEDPGATSKVAIDRATQIRDSARANMKSIRASVSTAKNLLSYTYLRAPFDGVIVETYAENFETVVPRQPILRVLDPSSIEFIISVAETLIGYAPYVKEILVRFDALPGQDISAQIKEVGKGRDLLPEAAGPEHRGELDPQHRDQRDLRCAFRSHVGHNALFLQRGGRHKQHREHSVFRYGSRGLSPGG